MRIDVTFGSAGIDIAGHLYLPGNTTPGTADRLPSVVVGHPASGVKEQTAGLYARRLAEHGFAALAFDCAYQGESGGLPRNLEHPAHRVEDLRAAVSFLTTRPDIDPERIGMLGICASGGYAVSAAATDHRVKALATISAVDIGRAYREGADGSQPPEVVQGMLDQAAAARTAEARGAETATFPIFPATEQQARSGDLHLFEGWEYYCTDRGQHPRSAKVQTWNSVDRIVAFDAFRFVAMIAPRPLLMIVGSEAVTRHMSADAIAAASGPKELHEIPGATHVALYDRDEYVAPALAKLRDFFRDGLGDRFTTSASARA